MNQNDTQFGRMLAVARQRLSCRTPQKIAEDASVCYENGAFVIPTLGQTVRVLFPDCTILPPQSKWHALTLLHYLDLADGAAQTGRAITFSQYTDGLVRGGNFDRSTEWIVRQDLGMLPPGELKNRCRALGAEILNSNADFCARFQFAPRYPLWLKIWFADEEFPASGRLLTDESAPHFLSIEDAVTVGSLILDALTGKRHLTI